MLVAHLDPLASSLFSLMAITSLLLAFVMLGSRWLKNYLYAFAAESWVIAALSAAVGFYGNYPELYARRWCDLCRLRACCFLSHRPIARPRRHRSCIGAHDHAFDEADRISDAHSAP